MNSTQNNNIDEESSDIVFDFQDLIYLYISKWRWCLLSLILALGIGSYYVLKTPSVYVRSASILIKEDSKGAGISSDVTSMFSDMGLSPGQTNVQNEMIAINNPAIILDVIQRLHLDINYSSFGPFHKNVLYGSGLPVKISFLDLADNNSATLELKLGKNKEVNLSNFKSLDINEEKTFKGHLKDTINTPFGRIIVIPTTYYKDNFQDIIYVSKTNLYNKVYACQNNLTVNLSEKQSTVINLTYQDICIQRADDILNTLIAQYKENWVNDKNQITVSTSLFIKDRISIIEKELNNVDEDISSYKSKNLLPDIKEASSLYMTESSENNSLILKLNTNLSMARFIRNDLIGSISNKNQLLPANSGIESASIEDQISKYNSILLQRNNLVANSSNKNPIVIDLDKSLESLRGAIVSSIDNYITQLNTQISDLQTNEAKTNARIAGNPNQAKYLMSVERQQKIKESLYLFLLQKREENELSQAFTAYNTRILSPPSGSTNPIAPKKKIIIFISFIMGLFFPGVVFYLMLTLNTTIRSKKDIENLTIPFIGEIPLAERKKHFSLLRKKYYSLLHKKNINEENKNSKNIIVKKGSRDFINEAFRVVRTNLEFMTSKNKSNVIILTSYNSGAGKTFLTTNIAITLAIRNKKVLLIEGDLRHASLSNYVPKNKKGLSDYLEGSINDINEIIVKGTHYDGFLDIITVGTIPPNPTELLLNDRLEVLINEVRNKYDYIFIDCPPIDIVADTQIIEKVADRTIFVVRTGLLHRNMVNDIENLYKNNRFKNMSLILNGTALSNGRYGYKYGYRYGYGYHSYNVTEKDK